MRRLRTVKVSSRSVVALTASPPPSLVAHLGALVVLEHHRPAQLLEAVEGLPPLSLKPLASHPCRRLSFMLQRSFI